MAMLETIPWCQWPLNLPDQSKLAGHVLGLDMETNRHNSD